MCRSPLAGVGRLFLRSGSTPPLFWLIGGNPVTKNCAKGTTAKTNFLVGNHRNSRSIPLPVWTLYASNWLTLDTNGSAHLPPREEREFTVAPHADFYDGESSLLDEKHRFDPHSHVLNESYLLQLSSLCYGGGLSRGFACPTKSCRPLTGCSVGKNFLASFRS